MNNRFCWWSYTGTSVPTIKAPHWLLRRAPRQQQVTGEDSNYHFPLRFCLSHSCAPARRSTTWTDLGGAQVRTKRWMLLEVGLAGCCISNRPTSLYYYIVDPTSWSPPRTSIQEEQFNRFGIICSECVEWNTRFCGSLVAEVFHSSASSPWMAISFARQ